MVRMELFRSAEMNLVQLIIPSESAHDTVTYLAELGLIQFKDVRTLLPFLCLECLGLDLKPHRRLEVSFFYFLKRCAVRLQYLVLPRRNNAHCECKEMWSQW
jgi:hypothetical protein